MAQPAQYLQTASRYTTALHATSTVPMQCKPTEAIPLVPSLQVAFGVRRLTLCSPVLLVPLYFCKRFVRSLPFAFTKYRAPKSDRGILGRTLLRPWRQIEFTDGKTLPTLAFLPVPFLACGVYGMGDSHCSSFGFWKGCRLDEQFLLALVDTSSGFEEVESTSLSLFPLTLRQWRSEFEWDISQITPSYHSSPL